MKTTFALLIAALFALGGCAGRRDDPEREWQRAECERKIEREDRMRCLKRLDAEYGGRSSEEAPPRKP